MKIKFELDDDLRLKIYYCLQLGREYGDLLNPDISLQDFCVSCCKDTLKFYVEDCIDFYERQVFKKPRDDDYVEVNLFERRNHEKTFES